MFTHHMGHLERCMGIRCTTWYSKYISCYASQWWWFNIHRLLFFIFRFCFSLLHHFVIVVVWSPHQIHFTFHSNALIILQTLPFFVPLHTAIWHKQGVPEKNGDANSTLFLIRMHKKNRTKQNNKNFYESEWTEWEKKRNRTKNEER